MQQTKPIKRSEELSSLSRDHHDGLLLCWKIRKGFANNTETKRIADYTLGFYEAGLKEHFRKEEDYLFILLPENNLLRNQAEDEHKILREYIESIKAGTGQLAGLLKNFADFLEKHIRFEERQLFPYIEERSERMGLINAGIKINTRERIHEMEWNDKFWLK